MATKVHEIWGVLGGMGPLASAEFVKSIYEYSLDGVEQDSPTIILLSDPTTPDRTCSLLHGDEEALLKHLTANINILAAAGATRVIVCCVTMHAVICRLSPVWQSKIVSLLDIIFNALVQSRRSHLLMCTEGTIRLRLLQAHERWSAVADRVIFPDAPDQQVIHKLIYEVKRNRRTPQHVRTVENLLARYSVESYIAGCTEMHLIAKQQEEMTGRAREEFCIDPLTAILPMIRQCVSSV